MSELIRLFKKNPLYLLLLVAPMFEAIWVNVTGVNIINLLTKGSNSTFWISLISFITLAPGSVFMLFTSRLASYRIMPFVIIVEAIVQFIVSFSIGLNIESLSPIKIVIFQTVIVITNAIATPCIFMLNRDVLKRDELKVGATGDTIFYMLTNSLGLILAPITYYNLNLKYIFFIEGILAVVTAGLLFLVFLKIPRRKLKTAVCADNKSSKLDNYNFFKLFFKTRSNILTFIFPPLLYLAMSLPTAGLPVWIAQNKNITLNFTIFYAVLLWIRTLGGFAGGFLFQKYYPSKKRNATVSILVCIAVAPLLYGFVGSLSSLIYLIPLILLSHTLSNYSYSAVWYEVDCLGEGNYIARIHSSLLIVDSLILSTGPLIIGRFADSIGVKAIWIANSIFIFLVIVVIKSCITFTRKEKLI